MNRTLSLGAGFALAVVIAGCSQARPNALPVGSMGDSDPVAAIIERRPELQLADTQVAVLRILKRDLDRVNRPLREELERLKMIRPQDGLRRLPDAPTKEQREKGKPLVEELRENNRRARDAAMELLSATQRTKLDSLEKAARARRQEQRRRDTPPPV